MVDLRPVPDVVRSLRVLYDERLAKSGPVIALGLAVSSMQAEAEFLTARLGPSAAYELFARTADGIIAKAAEGRAAPGEQASGARGRESGVGSRESVVGEGRRWPWWRR